MITENRLRVPIEEAFCILLRRLAYPNRLKDLERTFGRNYSSISRVANELLDIIFARWEHIVNFDQNRLTPQKLIQFADAIFEKGAPLMNCWGFIDGTVRPTCRPTMVSYS